MGDDWAAGRVLKIHFHFVYNVYFRRFVSISDRHAYLCSRLLSYASVVYVVRSLSLVKVRHNLVIVFNDPSDG